MYEVRDFVVSGGLIAYGVNWRDFPRLAAGLLDQIFTGIPTAEIPVQQVSKLELILSRKAAELANAADRYSARRRGNRIKMISARSSLRCMSPFMALLRLPAMSGLRSLSGEKRT
jgi:hypothetical protein